MSKDWEEALEAEIRKNYSETLIDHGRNPRNLGDLEESNAFGILDGPCGDIMAIWLNVEDNTITDIGFTTDGCIASLAIGSMTTEMAKGKTLTDAQHINQQDILDALGGLPKENEHRVLLWINTLQEAITNYQTEAAHRYYE